MAGGEDVRGEEGVRAPALRHAAADAVFFRQGEGGGGDPGAAGRAELRLPARETTPVATSVLHWVMISRGFHGPGLAMRNI